MTAPSVVVDNEIQDAQNVVPYVLEPHKEPEPEVLTYLCMPLVLCGVVFHIYPFFYVCLFVIISSWLNAKYGEFNFQQYSSIFLMCIMGFLMPLLQPAPPHPARKSPPPPPPPPPSSSSSSPSSSNAAGSG